MTKLTASTPPGETLAAMAADLLHDAHAAVSFPEAPADEAVHDFRKAIKRWRAFLRLVEPVIGDEAKALQRAARDPSRKLGRARDLRATLDAIEDLRRRGGPDATVLDRARDRILPLLAEAETTHADMPLREAAGREVLLWQQTVSRWNFKGIGIDEFSKALAKGYRRARKAAPKRFAAADEETLHDFRKRVIDHRYQIELIKPLSPEAVKARVDDAQRLRDALGMHRDLALLRITAESGSPLHEFSEDLLPAIARRQKKHLAQAQKLAAHLFAPRPHAFREEILALWQQQPE